VSRPKSEEEWLVFAAASILAEMAGLQAEAAPPPSREVVSADRCYRLEGHRLQTSTGSTGPILLVFVEPAAAPELPLLSDAALRQRFRLTTKEVKVARLIAQEWSNERIAAELSISPHTARHHTERILAKLGVKSRTKVRNALAQ
jgi:DNA-binding CsgD family transcriptional regulator